VAAEGADGTRTSLLWRRQGEEGEEKEEYCLAAFTSHPGRLKFMFILYIIEENAMSRIICRITRNISNKGISGIKEYQE
jgi:hypothetical protein